MNGQPGFWRRWVVGFFWAWVGAMSLHMSLHMPLASAQDRVANPAPVKVEDERGVWVQLPKPPLRIVSLLPSLTETVCALGQCKRLVGVDRYSNWPASVQNLPKMGGGLDPSLEAIVALRPDLVLAATSARSVTRLENLGIPVAALEPRNFKDMQRVFAKVGQLLGTPDTDKVWQSLVTDLDQVARSIPSNQKHTRVYVEVNRGPYGASASSFIGEVLTQMGMDNIVPGHLGPFPKLNPEFIVKANPDLIMVGDQESDALAQRPGWDTIRAVREKRVCRFSPTEGDILVRAGPRMADAARLMARCIAQKASKAKSP